MFALPRPENPAEKRSGSHNQQRRDLRPDGRFRRAGVERYGGNRRQQNRERARVPDGRAFRQACGYTPPKHGRGGTQQNGECLEGGAGIGVRLMTGQSKCRDSADREYRIAAQNCNDASHANAFLTLQIAGGDDPCEGIPSAATPRRA